MTERLDADQLLRALADAWRSAGRSKDFPWDADSPDVIANTRDKGT